MFGTKFGIYEQFGSGSFWFLLILTVVVCILPGYIFEVYVCACARLSAILSRVYTLCRVQVNWWPTQVDTVRAMRIPKHRSRLTQEVMTHIRK